MKTTLENTTTVLNSLVIINNDRYEGYKTAAEETKDADLKSLFQRFSSQSNQFNTDLRRHLTSGDAPDHDETTISGKLYRAWMDIKSALSTNDRKTVLESCEFGEDVALGTYKEALEDENISEEVRILIRKQKSELQEAHNTIKSLRDREKIS